MQIKHFFEFKEDDNIPSYEFGLEDVSKGFTKDGPSEISLNVTVYDFSVECRFNIHELLMKKNVN